MSNPASSFGSNSANPRQKPHDQRAPLVRRSSAESKNDLIRKAKVTVRNMRPAIGPRVNIPGTNVVMIRLTVKDIAESSNPLESAAESTGAPQNHSNGLSAASSLAILKTSSIVISS